MQIAPTQLRQLQTILSKRKLDRAERLDFLASEFNRAFSSTKELSFIEADELIYFLRTGKKQPANWAYFDNGNPQHRKLLSQLRTAQWVVEKEKYGFVADLERLSNFLKSPKSPVNKPLKVMSKTEVSKIVFVFDQIIKGTYK